MTKTLQKKFIKVAMLAVTALIVAMLIGLNIFNLISTNSQLHNTMSLLAQYGGEMGNMDSDKKHSDRQSDDAGAVAADDDPTYTSEDSSTDAETISPEETDPANENASGSTDSTAETDSTGETAAESPDPADKPDSEPAIPENPDMNAENLPDQAEEEENPDGSVIDDFRKGRNQFSNPDERTFITSAYFAVRFDSEGNAVYINTNQFISIEDDDAVTIASEVYNSGKSSGYIGSYMYSISENPFADGASVIILDTSEERGSFLRVLLLSVIIGIVIWLAMFALVFLLSKKAISPIAKNIEKQKRFITDAGHELKTPLAIILSNTEAMELFNGESKWSTNIKNQVTRLSGMTANLLTLAKMDESADNMVYETISLSEMVMENVNSFAGSFGQKGVSFESNVQNDIEYKGDRKQLNQLFTLLFDNAVKYTPENGRASASLTAKGRKICFRLENTCESIPSCPPEQLFDRFYRADEAHNQKTGGQGIGLSVAQSIAQNHNAAIKAEYIGEHSIAFEVTF